MPKTYQKELAFAKDLAAHAGQIMKRYFRAENIGTVWKEDDTPLTIADTTINDLVIERVKQVFPQHGVIGEEASYETERDFVWVVDPIDGTMPFSLGMPLSMFSLALVDRSDGQSVLGVAYEPQLDHLYWAVKGGGAFLDDKPVKVSDKKDLKNSYLSIMGGHTKEFKSGQAKDIANVAGARTFVLFSQVYSAVKVATGDLVGSIFGYGSPWDSAAVSIIVEEAGGVVTDMMGNQRRYDEWSDGCILSANKEIHEELLKIVKEASS